MPFIPELFSAPTLQRIEDGWQTDKLRAVPYLDGLTAARSSDRSPASRNCTTRWLAAVRMYDDAEPPLVGAPTVVT